MSTRKFSNLILTDNYFDKNDITKKYNFDSSTITPNNTRTYTMPNQNTVLIGNDTTNTLTNKTITDNTNNVAANSLKTTGSSVNVSSAPPPTTGQILTASSATTSIWKNPSNIYFNKSGTVTQPLLPNIIQWHGYATTSTGSVTFDITTTGSGGAAIFSDLANAFFYTSCQKNTTSVTDTPFSSINVINTVNNTVSVNVHTGNSGSILVGGTYVGMKLNSTSCRVYLYIVGT